MLRKKDVFTVITPIPGFIPRQLAIDILHSHGEVITLNPLVLEHKPIKAPRDAAADEYYSTWYEITERIQYVPGLGKMGSGKISFNGCFHNMPWGLQTHIYAPMNIDLRNKYRIAGNQPGYEPAQPLEMGIANLGAPADGLYLHEDIEIKCNIAAMSFVKAQLKAAGKEMVSRIIKKAELLDAGVLQAMIEDGRLKTYNPSDRTNMLSGGPLVSPLPQPSPTGGYDPFPAAPVSPRIPYQVPRVGSMHGYRPGSAASGGWATPPPPGYAQTHPGHPGPSELPLNPNAIPTSFPMELPGDFHHPQRSATSSSPAPSPHLQPASASTPGRQSFRESTSASSQQPSPDPRHASIQGFPGSQEQQTAYASSTGPVATSAPGRSPGLPTHPETTEDGKPQQSPQKQPQGQQPGQPLQKTYSYNPQDYAKVPTQRLPQQGSQPQVQGTPYGYVQ